VRVDEEKDSKAEKEEYSKAGQEENGKSKTVVWPVCQLEN
jgi:hypothetical protein